MKVVVNKETREFMTTHTHPDGLQDHHEIVEVEDEAFNTALHDAMTLGPDHTLDVFEDGRISIRKLDTPPDTDLETLKMFLSSEDFSVKDMGAALQALIRRMTGLK